MVNYKITSVTVNTTDRSVKCSCTVNEDYVCFELYFKLRSFVAHIKRNNLSIKNIQVYFVNE